MALSKTTVTQLSRYLSNWILRDIKDLFEAESIYHDADYVAPTSGQRRSLVDAYLSTVPSTTNDNIQRLLQVFEHVLVKLNAEIEDRPAEYRAIEAEQTLKNLLRWLQRDRYCNRSA